MKKIFLTVFLLTPALLLSAQNTSQVLYSSSGGIFAACINESGLIVEKENTAELIDTQPYGLAVIKGGIPAPAPNQRLVFSAEGRYALLLTYTGAGDYLQISEFDIINVKAQGPEGRQIWENIPNGYRLNEWGQVVKLLQHPRTIYI